MPRLIVGVILIALLSACAGGGSATQKFIRDDNYTIPKQIRYSFTVTNTSNQLQESAKFWTYLPISQTAHQKVLKVSANYPYQEKHDKLGNSSIHFDLKSIPPYGSRIVSVTVDLMMSERSVSAALENPSRFTSRENNIESDDARIVALATSLMNESTPLMAKNGFDWVAQNINSDGYHAEDHGAVYAFEARKGDCTEFSNLLTAIYRAQQIPARVMGGYVFEGNGIASATDYHNWSEFYFDGAWHISDAQKGHFVEKQSDYVAMRLISTNDNEEMPAQRFSFVGKNLKVEMN